MKKKRFEWYECFYIRMLLQLISILVFDNKSRIMSMRFLEAAKLSGVQLIIIIIKFQK